MSQTSKRQNSHSPGPISAPLEWISAALGLLLAIAILGLIGWDALTGNGSGAPAVSVQVDRIARTSAGYVVEVTARNETDNTAAEVQLEAQLKQAGQTLETSQATISYVPGSSERKAGFFFTRDPRAARLEVRATGYEEP